MIHFVKNTALTFLFAPLYIEYVMTLFSSYSCIFWNQEKLKDKDAQLEEMKKLLSEKEEKISQLERDLSNCKVELTDREKRIKDSLQAEVYYCPFNLKSEIFAIDVFDSFYVQIMFILYRLI